MSGRHRRCTWRTHEWEWQGLVVQCLVCRRCGKIESNGG